LLIGFVARGAMAPVEEAAPVMASGSTTQEFPVQTVANAAPADGMVLTQFIFEGKARSVSLVGDFNEWKGGESPLTQLEGGLWTTSIALTPGRHVYAFLVDDTLVVADPRAPKAGDSDYGQEGSVVMVFAR
jgi:1,4-alpha-glucan branching enzyme